MCSIRLAAERPRPPAVATDLRLHFVSVQAASLACMHCIKSRLLSYCLCAAAGTMKKGEEAKLVVRPDCEFAPVGSTRV